MKNIPLADRMRPKDFTGFLGQGKLVGEGKILQKLIQKDQVSSMIFWGPPGCGKTTLARIVASKTKAKFIQISAVTQGIKDLKDILKEAISRHDRKDIQEDIFGEVTGNMTILFIDEIHRWNKSQQDALLPYVENGVITLIGATTENPSFEINSALLSRCKVFVFEKLNIEELKKILKNAIGEINKDIGDDIIEYIASISNGDARSALNTLELSLDYIGDDKIDVDKIKEAIERTHYYYDKEGEEHYNIISALHKSMRGSDANAALYWLGRMLQGGENPLYIARRLIRFASEDIGLADPSALTLAVSAHQASHMIGMPECELALAECVAYMAKCKKSNQLYRAYEEIKQDIKNMPNEPVPLHIRNAPTKMMKELDYGKDYKYSPEYNYKEDQSYLPDSLIGKDWLKDK